MFKRSLFLSFLATLTLSAMLIMTPAYAAPKTKAPKPKISMKQAREIAQKAVPDGKIKSAELETEEGKRIYSFDIKSKDGIKEVWVDPQSGEVIKNEVETPAQEKAEKAKDKQHK